MTQHQPRRYHGTGPVPPVPTDIASRGLPGGEGGGVGVWTPSPAGALGPPLERPEAPQIGRGQTMIQPPEIYPHPGSVYINGQGSATGLDTATTTPAVVLATVTIPAQNMAVIRGLTLGINNMLTSTNVTWTLRFNGSPVPGWTNLALFPRAAGSVSASFEAESTVIRVPEGVTVDVVTRVLDAGTYQIGATFQGWFYSKRIFQIYESAYGH